MNKRRFASGPSGKHGPASPGGPDAGDELVGPAIPATPSPPVAARHDLSDPWYRPAKQYLRREQWNDGILQLLNKLPAPAGGAEMVLRYVGLPGQHHLDVLSMGGICQQKRLRLDYLGFRTGAGPGARAVYLEELSVLSRSRYFTARSITYPDSVENIGRANSLATVNYDERGPFDIINLDVCGGILHGDTTPLLGAIKYVLTSQASRQQPWLLFVTTTAKASEVAEDVIAKFFSMVVENCDKFAPFRNELASAAARCGLSVEASLSKPGELNQAGFLKFFTLAFGKWLLANLGSNRPPSSISLHSVYCFRNTDRPEPEMLSFAYLVTPVIGGGPDPTGLTREQAKTPDAEYAEAAVRLVCPSIEGIRDLDDVWDKEPYLKTRVVAECERLLSLIGVDQEGVAEWREKHRLPP